MIDILFENLIYLFDNTTIFTFSAYVGSGILLIQFIFNLFGWSDTENFYEDDGVGEAKKFKYLSLQNGIVVVTPKMAKGHLLQILLANLRNFCQPYTILPP